MGKKEQGLHDFPYLPDSVSAMPANMLDETSTSTPSFAHHNLAILYLPSVSLRSAIQG
jgi:hypothetical protein